MVTRTRLRIDAAGQTETEVPKGSQRRSSISPRPRNRTPPDNSSDKMPARASDAELDPAAERASALDILNAKFGEVNDWAGAESVDSDVEISHFPRTLSGPPEPTFFEVVSAVKEPSLPRGREQVCC